MPILAMLLNVLPLVFVILFVKHYITHNKNSVLKYIKEEPCYNILEMLDYFPNGFVLKNGAIYLNYFDNSIILLDDKEHELLNYRLSDALVLDDCIKFSYKTKVYKILLLSCEQFYL